MPTQTFLNLPEEKRNRITESAIDEFSNRPYEAASLSKIVEDAGISKGSMYQYFVDKKDLYLYLLDVAGQIKVRYMEGILDPADDFFAMLEKIIIASSRFNFAHPRLNQLVVNMLSGHNDPFPGDTFAYLRQAGQNWVKQIIQKSQATGQIRTDIDADLLAYLVNRMTMDFGIYLLESANLTHADLSEGKAISEEVLVSATRSFISILRNGIGTRYD